MKKPVGVSALMVGHDPAMAADRADPPSLEISDHSLLARTGLKGRGAYDWLERRGITPPPSPNSWCVDAQTLIVRLGPHEFLLEGLSVPCLDTAGIGPEDFVYPVVRQDTALALRGPGLLAVIAQTCALDVRAFDPQDRPAWLTLMAEIPVLLIADLRGPVPCALVWTCRSHGAYLCETLLTACRASGRHAIVRPPDHRDRFPQSSYLAHPQRETS